MAPKRSESLIIVRRRCSDRIIKGTIPWRSDLVTLELLDTNSYNDIIERMEIAKMPLTGKPDKPAKPNAEDDDPIDEDLDETTRASNVGRKGKDKTIDTGEKDKTVDAAGKGKPAGTARLPWKVEVDNNEDEDGSLEGTQNQQLLLAYGSLDERPDPDPPMPKLHGAPIGTVVDDAIPSRTVFAYIDEDNVLVYYPVRYNQKWQGIRLGKGHFKRWITEIKIEWKDIEDQVYIHSVTNASSKDPDDSKLRRYIWEKMTQQGQTKGWNWFGHEDMIANPFIRRFSNAHAELRSSVNKDPSKFFGLMNRALNEQELIAMAEQSMVAIASRSNEYITACEAFQHTYQEPSNGEDLENSSLRRCATAVTVLQKAWMLHTRHTQLLFDARLKPTAKWHSKIKFDKNMFQYLKLRKADGPYVQMAKDDVFLGKSYEQMLMIPPTSNPDDTQAPTDKGLQAESSAQTTKTVAKPKAEKAGDDSDVEMVIA